MDTLTLSVRHQQEITRYGLQGFFVAGVQYSGAILLSADYISAINTPTVLSYENIRTICLALPTKPEILLLGTGKSQQFIAPNVRAALKVTDNMVLDSMDSGAACRTFNLLLSEGRSVAAILLPMQG